MNISKRSCFRCAEEDESFLEDLYGYTVCNACTIKLGLYHDETIQKHASSYQRAKDLDPAKPSYQEEVDRRLVMMEKDYIAKRIKLLHIRYRLRNS
ncbi:hypothetical protein FNH22_30625 [Fulvivirga sp. M361]|uniref:hypothetical protein n=1 Tax=Fulvivirga sp. M361 TaxID=2594266 RepID=UPI00117A42C9|nr:hypothetical protein [Fulvivirga sp. M361]TRX47053.1 hypothetical protein FNH22_30625 [Fulvivirga sp. M361]